MDVVTYQLAYLPGRAVELCAGCVESGAHGAGTLGPVSHGQHRGWCEGRSHHWATNQEGLTREEWLAAARRADSAEMRDAWWAGEDPAEYAAEGEVV